MSNQARLAFGWPQSQVRRAAANTFASKLSHVRLEGAATNLVPSRAGESEEEEAGECLHLRLDPLLAATTTMADPSQPS